MSNFKIRIAGLFKVEYLNMTWNTTLQEKLDEFCNKYALDSTQYTFTSVHKKNLDLTVPFRATGLSPNAHLDIVPISELKPTFKASKGIPAVSKCTICFVLPNGDREKVEVRLRDTLWKALKQLENQIKKNITRIFNEDVYQCPSIQYLNHSYTSINGLQNSLRSIGISKGEEVLFRLSFTPEKSEGIQEKLREVDSETTESSTDYQSLEPVVTSSDKVTSETQKSPESMEIDTTYKSINIPDIAARNIKIFTVGSGEVEEIEVSEEDFELQPSDMKELVASIQQKQKEREVFMSRAVKKRQYEEAIIRVRFSSGYILQGTFSVKATVRDIHHMIQSVLKDTNVDFHLYTAPPIVRYNNLNETIENLNFAPAIMLNIGSKNTVELRESILENLQPLQKEVIPKSINHDSPKPTTAQQVPKEAPTKSSERKPMPKWFQMGFKK